MARYFILSFFTQTLIAATTPYVQIFLRNKGYSFSLIGVIVALGQVCSIIFPLIIGSISDKTGKAKLILYGVILLTVAFAFPVLLSGSLTMTIICYCLMCAGVYSVNPMVDGFLNAQSVGHPSRYSNMRAVGTMGYVTVLVLFALTKWPDPTQNSSIIKGIILTACLMSLALLGVKTDGKTKKDKKDDKFFDFNWFGKSFYLFIFIVGLTRVTETVVDKFLSSYITEVLGVVGNFTLFYAISATSEFIFMFIGGRLLEKGKVTPIQLVSCSAIGLVLRMMITYLFPTPVGLACAQLFHALTFGALQISAAAFVASHVEKEHYTMAMSFYWAVGINFPMLLGSLAGGFVIDTWGYPMLFLSYSFFSVIAYVLCMACKKTLNAEVSK